jgi:hypothetical protein
VHLRDVHSTPSACQNSDDYVHLLIIYILLIFFKKEGVPIIQEIKFGAKKIDRLEKDFSFFLWSELWNPDLFKNWPGM